MVVCGAAYACGIRLAGGGYCIRRRAVVLSAIRGRYFGHNPSSHCGILDRLSCYGYVTPR